MFIHIINRGEPKRIVKFKGLTHRCRSARAASLDRQILHRGKESERASERASERE